MYCFTSHCLMISPFRLGQHFLCMNSAIVSSPCQIRAWIQMKWQICVSGDKSSYIPGPNCVPVTPLIIYSVCSLDAMIEICVCDGGKWFPQPSGRDLVESLQTEGVCYVTVSSPHNSVLQTPHQPRDGCCPLWLPLDNAHGVNVSV